MEKAFETVIHLDVQKGLSDTLKPEALLAEVVKTVESVVLPTAWQQSMPRAVGVRFTGDAEVQAMNLKFRHKDKPTNILSFPYESDFPEHEVAYYLGDMVLSVDTLQQEAVAQHKPINAHLKHLFVHGLLHLYGFDHIDDREADVMEDLECRILALLGVENPYMIIEDE